ncbi:gephyrin-like molybdotransferase Glp [Glaciihabitans sp. UYNi722]|uniref:molybdopterin molybdotransferase MoeA n=1 Tax=Glaciihabitans sp. UYNi722 TaxID=3156344 RepID=UPI0033924AA6
MDAARATVEEHAAHVRELLAEALQPRAELVPLGDALGRVTFAEVLSPVDLPLFRNSQMDGFAVVASDIASAPTRLPIVGEVAARAGQPSALQPGTAVRIMTGAVVPDGADAVVPIEDTASDGDTVTITRSRSPGEYVRDRGSDLRAGDRLLPAALRLASRHLAALAAAGIGEVEVRSRVRVAVVTTGAELIEPGRPAALGEVYDANGIALESAVPASGAVVSFAARNQDDDPKSLRASMVEAARGADLIITSGGISMGDYEVVRELLEPLGARVGTVAMQPGGPQATGEFNGIPVVSFPGNPVSTQISFEIFVAPLLREVAGLAAAERRQLMLAADLRSAPGKRQFLRGRTLPGERVEIVSGPGSHLVAGLAASDVLVDVPLETTELKEGDTVETWQL